MSAAASVSVTGLAELQRSLRRAGSELYPQVRESLREIGEMVAQEARSIATGKGLVLTGRLVKSIRPTVRTRDVVIKATAKQRGYNYPARYEFGDRNRPFLRPAVAAKEAEVHRRLELAIDRLLGRADL